jgi:hypothetical protein
MPVRRDHEGRASAALGNMESKMKNILLASAVAGSALFAVTTASFAQASFNGPQTPYATNTAPYSTYGQSYGQVGGSDRVQAAPVTTQRRAVQQRYQTRQIGEPAPGQQED